MGEVERTIPILIISQKWKTDNMSKLKTNHNNTSLVLRESFNSLIAGITGLASSEKKEIILSIGYVFQKFRSGNFLKVLSDEWEKFKKMGRISDEYEKTEQHQACLQEMLDFLDKDTPDEIRFSFLKKMINLFFM